MSATRELLLRAEAPPITRGDRGVLRVGESRVSLELLIEEYENGMSPEDLVRAYDTLALADVYAAIAYYLSHRDEVQAYLRRRADEAVAAKSRIEAEHAPLTRDELRQRHRASSACDDSPGQ